MSGRLRLLAMQPSPLSLFRGLLRKANFSCLDRRPQMGLCTLLRLLLDSDLSRPGPPMCTRRRFGRRASAGFKTGNSLSGAEAASRVPEEGPAVRIWRKSGRALDTGGRMALRQQQQANVPLSGAGARSAEASALTAG